VLAIGCYRAGPPVPGVSAHRIVDVAKKPAARPTVASVTGR
jgi:hypothetical protein